MPKGGSEPACAYLIASVTFGVVVLPISGVTLSTTLPPEVPCGIVMVSLPLESGASTYLTEPVGVPPTAATKFAAVVAVYVICAKP